MSNQDYKFIPFALPDIGEEEIQAVVATLKSGWITTGPVTKEFEENFSKFLADDVEAMAVSSATAGLHLALEACGIGEGDEVITTTYTFTATAEVIRYLGADPVFVDVEDNSLNIDASKIEEKITSKTKAIIPVHFAGLSCDMDSIFKIAKKHNLKVIEDAAHALPTTYKKKIIGTLDSDFTVFSFYATKSITTGEGGMVVTKNKQLANRLRIMRHHGIDRDSFDRYISKKPSWHYDVVAPGFKYNLTDMASAIGVEQLKKADRFQSRREEISKQYFEGLKNLNITMPAITDTDDKHAWHLFVIRINDTKKYPRDQFIEYMLNSGIGCSVHFTPLHLQTYWKSKYNLKASDFPNAQKAYESIVSLPIYTKLSDDDVSRIIKRCQALFRKS